MNFEKALKIRQADRSIFIEEGLFMGEGMALVPVEQAENLPSPRQIKSHLPIALLPKELMEVKPKVCNNWYNIINFTDFLLIFRSSSLPYIPTFNIFYSSYD